jgi:glutathione peroxidase
MLLQGTYKNITGEDVDLSKYLGRVVLVVNTASLCGFTEQYAVLEEIYQEYESRGFVVLAFPSGSFSEQELETDAEIADFCQSNFSITFPLFEKSDVLKDNELFLELARESEAPGWNFTKYLIGKDGELIKRFPSKYEHDDLVKAIEEGLRGN